jgi:hypothetical protein
MKSYSGTCLEGLRKTTTISVRVADFVPSLESTVRDRSLFACNVLSEFFVNNATALRVSEQGAELRAMFESKMKELSRG